MQIMFDYIFRIWNAVRGVSGQLNQILVTLLQIQAAQISPSQLQELLLLEQNNKAQLDSLAAAFAQQQADLDRIIKLLIPAPPVRFRIELKSR